jgi:hypothetical protein
VARYIVRWIGEGLRPAADLQRIRAAPGLTVLDDAARMLLVEANPRLLKQLLGSLPGWACTPERSLRLPDPRPRPRRGPGG